ncbi:hypothetical protein LXJ58_31235, partial [Escherichia coli]|nr:hypothetical protein [Escherichia coli]
MAPSPARADAASQRNMRQLVLLRWLAVGGQLAAIVVVHYWLGIRLPLIPMVSVLGGLVFLNLVTLLRLARWPVTHAELFGSLLVDVTALTVQLYLSGGA